MKKYLVILLAVLFMVPVTNFAARLDDISDSGEKFDIKENEGAFYNFDLTHDVSRISGFSVVAQSTAIQSIGSNIVAQFTVQNNTRDGYMVELKSLNGHLQPKSKADGEEPIEYTAVVKNKVGQLGIGMGLQNSGSFPSPEIKTETKVIAYTSTNELQTTATNVSFDLHVDVAAGEIDKMTMAGKFTDTLTLTYTDL